MNEGIFNSLKSERDISIKPTLSSEKSKIQEKPPLNEVAGDRVNLFVKSRIRYIENLDVTNLKWSDQNVRYIKVHDWFLKARLKTDDKTL